MAWGQTAHDFLHSSQIVQDFLRPGRTVQYFLALRKPRWVLGQIWSETARNHNFPKGILTGSRGQTFSRIMGSRRWRSKGPSLARLGGKQCRTVRTQANQCRTFCAQPDQDNMFFVPRRPKLLLGRVCPETTQNQHFKRSLNRKS